MTNTQITRTDTPLSALIKATANLTAAGWAPSVAMGHILATMATERPALLGKVLAEMADRPEFADRLDAILDASDHLALVTA